MTVKELIEELKVYPDDAEVDINCFDCGSTHIKSLELEGGEVTIFTS